MIEHKSFDVECKGLGDDSGSVEFYAAAFSNVDRAGERIEPGAFKNLDGFKSGGWLAVNHDWSRLGVATIEDAVQDAKGLRITAHFHSTADAQAVRTTIKERIARGKSVKASIGYKVLEDEDVKLDGKSVRSLKAIDLYEASIVNVPCNPEAGVVAAKSLMTIGELRDLVAEYKAGRVLSAANRATMQRWRDQHASLLAELDALLGATDPAPQLPLDPTTQPSIPKSLLPELVELNREFLATSARFGR
jgi:HK97 family phage prohead protease